MIIDCFQCVARRRMGIMAWQTTIQGRAWFTIAIFEGFLVHGSGWMGLATAIRKVNPCACDPSWSRARACSECFRLGEWNIFRLIIAWQNRDNSKFIIAVLKFNLLSCTFLERWLCTVRSYIGACFVHSGLAWWRISGSLMQSGYWTHLSTARP